MKMKKVSNVRRCRLCASEDILNNFYNIFDDNSELKLEMKIRKLLPVVVMSWDPMPHVVCHDCTAKLNTFNDFYETSLNTERFLRTLNCETPASPTTENEKGTEKRDGAPGKESNSLIITPLGCREYVYTCRRCCRTFTKESSAMVHPCAGVEDCGEVETDKKCLPPLKIRLFAVRSGLFVCYLCNEPFEDKGELGKHIKGHFLEGSWGEEATKYNKEGGKGEGCCREDDERGQPCADRPDSGRRRRKKRCLFSWKRRRVTARRLLEDHKEAGGTGEESSMQEEKICPTSTSSTKETTKDQTENSIREVSQGKETEMTEDSKSVTNEPGEVEISKGEGEDEVIVIKVLENRIPTMLSSCVFCDKIFATVDSLAAHKNKHLKNFRSNSDRGDPFQCDVCPKTFPSEGTLMEHLRSHNWGPLPGPRKALTPLNGFSPGGTISNNRGVFTSGEDEIPLSM